MNEDINNHICVYLHINPILQEIFYVGIGNVQRPYLKTSRRKEWADYVKLNGDYNVAVIYNNLSWNEAVKIEKQLIAQIGRKDKRLGTLINGTNGGEGFQDKDRWSTKELIQEASKYITRSDFYKGSRGAYKAAIRLGILDEICSHMPYNRNKFKLTKEKCLEIALKFTTQTDLAKSHKSVLNKIVTMNWQNECFAHMRQKVDKYYCKQVALKFNRCIDLITGNKYIYNVIVKNNWKEELFSHMTKF